jgi:His-Xaa-Ser system protein HxsD
MEKKEDSILVDVKDNSVLIKINPKIYPLPIVYQAADLFIDRCYVFLDGDPEEEIKVILKPKEEDVNLEALGGEFNNELLNYAAYFVRSQVNRDLRELMIKRAFFTTYRDSESGDEKNLEEKFEEKNLEKIKIDIGAKVPIVGDVKKEEDKTDTTNNEIQEFDEEFSLEEIAKPWEEQKGRIDSTKC